MANTIWVLVELEKGQPARSSLEVLGKAAQLGRAEAIVLGSVEQTRSMCMLMPSTTII